MFTFRFVVRLVRPTSPLDVYPYYIFAHARTPAYACKRVHVYNNVLRINPLTKMLLYVKNLLKSKLFIRKIWLFRKIVVLLHSLLRNALSLSDIRKSSLKDFT